VTATDDRRLLPEGWAPRPGARVRILPDPKAADDVPPPGVWYVVDRAPEVGHWWVWTSDHESREWAAASEYNHRLSRSLSYPSRRLTPAQTAVRGGV
jgi:hypothetical protein